MYLIVYIYTGSVLTLFVPYTIYVGINSHMKRSYLDKKLIGLSLMKILPNKIFIRPSIPKKTSRLTSVMTNPINALIIIVNDRKLLNTLQM